MPAKRNGSGIRETAPGKYVATMYDPRVKGNTKHIGVFTAPPQPNPKYPNRRLAERAAKEAKLDAERLRDLELKAPGKRLETIAEFAERWPRDYTDRRSENTLIHNAERIRALVKDFGDRPLWDGIETVEARAWVFGGIVPRDLREVARKWDRAKVVADGDVEIPDHRGNHLAVRAMFNDALKTRLTNDNPFSSLNVPEKPGRRGKHITVITAAELALLVQVCHDVLGEYGIHFGALVGCAAWTGGRPGEMWATEIEHKTTRNWVDFQTGEFRIDWQIGQDGKRRRPKWGSARTVFLLPPAATAFRVATEERPNGPMFYTARGQPMSAQHIAHYWRQVRTAFWKELPADRRSKLAVRDGGPEAGRIPVDMAFYELRHFFGTQLAEMGLTPPEIADQMGHKDGGALAMARYIHPRSESVKRSMHERFAEYERRQAVGE